MIKGRIIAFFHGLRRFHRINICRSIPYRNIMQIWCHDCEKVFYDEIEQLQIDLRNDRLKGNETRVYK